MKTTEAIQTGGSTVATVCALLLSPQITTFGDTQPRLMPTQMQTFQVGWGATMALHILNETGSSSASIMVLPHQRADKKVIPAPIWLMKRMEALRQRPPPTSKTVREQWADSVAFSRRLGDRQNASLNGRGKKGILLTDSYTAGLTKYEEDTLEHVVYDDSLGRVDKSERRVIKCTKPGRFGYAHGPTGNRAKFTEATPHFYLQRLDLMNQVFGADLRLEGIAVETDSGNEENLKPYIVTSQRYVERADKNHPHPSEPEIEGFMKELNFSLIPNSVWNWFRESDGLIVLDTKQRNFINSPQGIVPIDLIIGKPDAI